MENAIIYARYSSNAQREVSIDQQISACRAFAERQGIQIVGVYDDRALTGTSDKRPGFQRMIADSGRGGWSYVIVYALDRFARDRYDSAIYKRKLKDFGVRVLSATENLTDDPTGVLLESLLEGMAEYYSRELAQKITRGMRDNAEKCMVNGLLPPGYKKGPDGKYMVDAPEAAVIREVFERIRNLEPINEILYDIERRGIRTRHGKPWTRNVIDRVLTNERYAGVYIYGDIRVEGGIPAIVERDLFDAVQLVLGSKKNPRKIDGVPQRRKRENGVYLLTGKLYCGDCKTPMVGVSGRNKASVPYYYYACKNHRAKICPTRPVRRDQIEYAITLAIQTCLLNDETIAAMADAIVFRQKQSRGNLELQGMEAELKEVKNSIRNIMQAIENGLYSQTMQKRMMELETREQELEATISYRRKQAEILPTREDIILALSLFQDGDPTDKNYQQTILDAFLIRAYVYDDKLRLVFRAGDAKISETEIPVDFDIDDILPDEAECSYKGSSVPPSKKL